MKTSLFLQNKNFLQVKGWNLISDVVSLHRIFPHLNKLYYIDICLRSIPGSPNVVRLFVSSNVENWRMMSDDLMTWWQEASQTIDLYIYVAIGQSRCQTKQAYLSPMGNFMIVLTLNSPHPAPSQTAATICPALYPQLSECPLLLITGRRAANCELWAASAAR